MKAVLFATLLLAGATAPASSADVGVSVTVGQPGFYGQITIGDVSPPRLIFVEPVVVHRTPRYVAADPIYLHVPPGHEKHWSKHCAKYNACGRPVYFVQSDWYNTEYVQHYKVNGSPNGKNGRANPHDKHEGNKKH